MASPVMTPRSSAFTNVRGPSWGCRGGAAAGPRGESKGSPGSSTVPKVRRADQAKPPVGTTLKTPSPSSRATASPRGPPTPNTNGTRIGRGGARAGPVEHPRERAVHLDRLAGEQRAELAGVLRHDAPGVRALAHREPPREAR